jgi:glycosyltransferase involved in cell wall biosynthesis
MKLDEITPLILTHNEDANLERTLLQLRWAKHIIVLDSGSTDSTIAVANAFANVRLLTRPFDNHTAQWNYGLEQVVSPWTLTLDADYFCPDELQRDLRELTPTLNAYKARFRYCIEGRPLHGTLYPPRVVLFRTTQFKYQPDGHTQLLYVTEPVGELKTVLLHDDRKPLARWLVAQSKYADLEVAKLRAAAPGSLDWKDRLRRRILWMPLITALYCLVYKRLVFDGWPGIYYSFQRVYAEFLLSMKLLAAKLRNSPEVGAVEPADVAATEADQKAIELSAVTATE